MKAKNKKVIVSALCALTLASAGIGLANVRSASADYLNDTLTMKSGASIYLGTVSGIRYTYTATNYDPNANYGMLIVPEDYLKKAGIEIGANTDYVTELQTKLTAEAYARVIVEENLTPVGEPADGETATFNHSIGNLQTYNYDRRFFGIGFVKNGNSYTYAQNNDNVRSVMYVASAALNDYKFDYDNLEAKYQTSYANNLATLGGHVATGISNVTDAFEYSIAGDTEMYVGDETTLSIDTAANDNRQVNLAAYWTTDDEDLATVENGVVTAAGVGATTVTAKTTVDGVNVAYTDTHEINVTQNPVTVFNSMVSSLDSDDPVYATMETAYNTYVGMTAAQQAEVATSYETLWNLIPKVLDDTALVDYSNTLAVAYNAKGAYYGKDSTFDNYATTADVAVDFADKTEAELAEYLESEEYRTAETTKGIQLVQSKTDALKFSTNEQYAFADDEKILRVDGTDFYVNRTADGVNWENSLYVHTLVDNPDYAGKTVGFYIAANTIEKNWRAFGFTEEVAFNSLSDGSLRETRVRQFCTTTIGESGTLLLNMAFNKTNAENLQVGGGFELYLTSLYEVSASYVDTLITLYEAETDETKQAQYQTKILDFYNALSEAEQANVTKMTGLFTAYVSGLSSTSTDDELIVGLNLYRSMSTTDQATVATSYATLQGSIESRLDTTAVVDYGSALAVAYNANGGVYGATSNGGTGVLMPTETSTVSYTYNSDWSFADDNGGLSIKSDGSVGKVEGDITYKAVVYAQEVLSNADYAGKTIGFYVDTYAARLIAVKENVSTGTGSDYQTTAGSATNWTFVTATVGTSGNLILNYRFYKSGTTSNVQVNAALDIKVTSVREITADYVNELLAEWKTLNEAGDAKATEYATKINDFYGALEDTTGVDSTLYEEFVAATAA